MIVNGHELEARVTFDPMQKPSPPLPRWDIALGVILLMLIAVMLAFGGSLAHGFVTLDDPLLIYGNLAVRGFSAENIRTIFTTFDPELYIPFTFLSYQANYALGGLHAEIYHLTNLLLHTANAALATWLASLILSSAHKDEHTTNRERIFALLIGMIFALHPLHTEAVAWLSARKDLLSTFFFFGSFIAYLLYRRGIRFSYLASLALFLAGLLSKVMIAPLPVLLLLHDALLERRTFHWTMIADKLPHLLLSGALMIVAVFGKERVLGSSSLLEIVLMSGRSTMFYIGKLLVPVNLSVFYPHTGPIAPSMPVFFVPLLLVAAVLCFAAWSWNRWPLMSFGIFFFLIALCPTFLNFHKGADMFFAVDRYAYAPSFGFLLAAAGVLAPLASRMEERIDAKKLDNLFLQAGGVILLAFCFLSMRQTALWDSTKSLYEHALALYPQSVSARVGLAQAYREEGKLDDELKVLQDGLASTPDVRLLTGIGSVYDRQKKPQDARKQYQQAMALDPANPEPYFYLGSLEQDGGNAEKAIDDYERAIALDPSYVAASNNAGSIRMERGEFEKALEHFNRALAYNPNFMEGHYNVGRILHSQGKLDEADEHLRKADLLNADSPDVLTAIAALRVDQKRYTEALALLKRILTLDKQNADAKAILQSLIERGIVGQQNERL